MASTVVDRHRHLLRCATLLLALPALTLLASPPVLAASTWWVSAPGPTRDLSDVASNSSTTTLGISGGRSYWLDVERGSLLATGDQGAATFVAASETRGWILNRDGSLYSSQLGGPARRLQSLPGRALGLAVSPAPHPTLVAVTSKGIYLGPAGDRLSPRGSPPAGSSLLALTGPVVRGQPFVVATTRGIYLLAADGHLALSRNSPRLGAGAAVAELGDGIIFAGDDRGTIYALYSIGWTPIFQILPQGGLQGVPNLTGIVGVGPDAAYVATRGFGTLLTPDGGYSWYRAAPSADVVALAALGPIYSRNPSGLVLAATPRGLFIHHLQTLPAPPTYAGSAETAQLLGTAAVTAVAAILAIAGLWAITRRRRRRLFV